MNFLPMGAYRMTKQGMILTLKKFGIAGPVAAIISAVFLCGVTISGYMGLPEQVEQNSVLLSTHTTEIAQLHEDDDEIKAILQEILCNQDPDKNWEQCKLEHGITQPTKKSPGDSR